MIKKLIIVGMAILLALLMFNMPDKKNQPFVVGEKIPELRFKDINGTDYFFNDFKGRVVLINHWATWCQYCLVEMPYLEEFKKQYSIEGVEIVTFLHDVENLDLAKEIISNYQITLPVLLVDDNPIFKVVEAVGLPYSILLDKDSTVRFIHQGFVPADAKKYESEIKYLLGKP